jgi:hypothetical protein
VNEDEYSVSVHIQMPSIFLVEGGANGGIVGTDVHSSCTGYIKGTDSHQVKGVTIGTVGCCC